MGYLMILRLVGGFLLKHWLPIACILALSAALAYAHHAGAESVRKATEAKALHAQLAQAQSALKAAQASQAVTERVVTKYVDRIVKVAGRTQTIIKEVPIYVPATTADLPGGFRLLHDASALGILPDPARIADAAPVPAQDVAETIASNYGVCQANAEQLTALQEWIKGQAALRR